MDDENPEISDQPGTAGSAQQAVGQRTTSSTSGDEEGGRGTADSPTGSQTGRCGCLPRLRSNKVASLEESRESDGEAQRQDVEPPGIPGTSRHVCGTATETCDDQDDAQARSGTERALDRPRRFLSRLCKTKVSPLESAPESTHRALPEFLDIVPLDYAGLRRLSSISRDSEVLCSPPPPSIATSGAGIEEPQAGFVKDYIESVVNTLEDSVPTASRIREYERFYDVAAGPAETTNSGELPLKRAYDTAFNPPTDAERQEEHDVRSSRLSFVSDVGSVLGDCDEGLMKVLRMLESLRTTMDGRGVAELFRSREIGESLDTSIATVESCIRSVSRHLSSVKRERLDDIRKLPPQE